MAISEKRRVELEDFRTKQILSVSLGLFYRRGFANTTVSDIAKAASISKGLIYRYFKSKADILFAYKEFLYKCFEEVEAMQPKAGIREAARRFLCEPDENGNFHPLRVYLLIFIKSELHDERFRDVLPQNYGHTFYGKMFEKGMVIGEFRQGDPYMFGDIYWHYLLGCALDDAITPETSAHSLKTLDAVLAFFEP
jgi:AcrR family transcriptional regulator